MSRPFRHRLYLLIHTPTELARPVQMGFTPQTEYYNSLFENYHEKVTKERLAGGSRAYLSKRDIERWGFFPPCGARVQVMEVELPTEEFLEIYKKEAEKSNKPMQ
jgi:hypothetical protein